MLVSCSRLDDRTEGLWCLLGLGVGCLPVREGRVEALGRLQPVGSELFGVATLQVDSLDEAFDDDRSVRAVDLKIRV